LEKSTKGPRFTSKQLALELAVDFNRFKNEAEQNHPTQLPVTLVQPLKDKSLNRNKDLVKTEIGEIP
jgi:hypothetical protein